MKLRKGESKAVYSQEDTTFDRDEVLNMVKGKTLSDGRSVVEQFKKETETIWVDKYEQPQAKSICNSVTAISVKPGGAEERQRELLDDLKIGLEAISGDDCSLDDIRKALKAQIAYSEYMELVND